MAIRPIKPIKRKRPSDLSVEAYLEGIARNDVQVLSQAITLLESTRPEHRELAEAILEGCLPMSGNSVRIGITGVPGVGKSTFIESLGTAILDHGHQLAVLAIDPSSERSRGSILGDKTRMERLASNPKAFIRPSPSSGSLGGVARATRETLLLCEAAGYDVIFVETVGVGQSETAVHSMVDFFLLLMLAGAGDELQGIKRGIMEMADALVINKADGQNVKAANRAKAEYRGALHLFPPSANGWSPKVLACSALEHTGINEVWQTVESFLEQTKGNGHFDLRRQEQSIYWMREHIQNRLQSDFYQHPEVKSELTQLEEKVRAGKMSSYTAADRLLGITRDSN